MTQLMRQSKSNKFEKNSQSGNVFIIILVGIVLFAALAYTFTRSGQTGVGNLTAQQSEIAAQEILNYARLVEGAVNRLRQNGCSENDISFEAANLAGHVNASAPGDNSCHIFDENGGQVTYQDPTTNWLDSNLSAGGFFGDYYFTTACVRGAGTDSGSADENAFCNTPNNNGEELLFILPYVSRAVCEKINQKLYRDTTIPQDATARYDMSSDFDGNLSSTNEIANNANDFENQSSFCFNSATTPAQFDFYHVILAR